MELIQTKDYLLLIDKEAEIENGDKFLSYLLMDDWGEDIESNRVYLVYTCLESKYKNEKIMPHYVSLETGRKGDDNKHFIFDPSTSNKVIAYYPLTKEAKELDLPLLPNHFEEVDVKALAEQHTLNFLDNYKSSNKESFIEGYKAAQSSTKQFSLEDIEKAFISGALTDLFNTWNISKNDYAKEKAEDYIQSLSTQRLPKEFIPEMVDNGEEDWIGDDVNGEPFWNEKLEPKIIINSDNKPEYVGTYKW